MSMNQLFPGEFVTCSRPGLREHTLTVVREVIVGENRSRSIVRRARIWEVSRKAAWFDKATQTMKIATVVDFVAEYELTPVAEAAA
jgi:hypothetical protein